MDGSGEGMWSDVDVAGDETDKTSVFVEAWLEVEVNEVSAVAADDGTPSPTYFTTSSPV